MTREDVAMTREDVAMTREDVAMTRAPGLARPTAGASTRDLRGASARDAARSAFVERVAEELVRGGMQRMAARVFAAVLSTDSGRMTAAELSELLQASPAAVSGAVRYLEQVEMIRRSREPGSRRDTFALADDVWYEALAHKDGILKLWQDTMGEGARALGLDTPAGHRMAEMQDFFAFMGEEMPALLDRWRARRDTRRTA